MTHPCPATGANPLSAAPASRVDTTLARRLINLREVVMTDHSMPTGSRRGRRQHRPIGWRDVYRQRGDWTAPARVPPAESATSEPASGDRARRGCAAWRSPEQFILQTLRARGGRLTLADLVFEGRWNGMQPAMTDAVLADLVARGLVRGPLSHPIAYELTAAGWDVCAAAIGRL